MNWKLAGELRRRGMADATSVYELELLEKKDGALIKALAESFEPCVLVTWDNKMTSNHEAELRHFALTLAIIDKSAERGGLSEEEYYREVTHRWAHRMARQWPGTWRRYSQAANVLLGPT
jgi:hypothetical protein